MQKKILTLTILAAITIAGFFSCKKEFSSENVASPGVITPVGSAIPEATPVSGSVAGIVVDENSNPVANADVVVANTTYKTDSKGFFNTAEHTLDKYISTVRVNKAGYFTCYRSFCANATKNYVSIKLVPKTLTGTFSSGSAGKINLQNGTEISFQANAVVDKISGAAYSGTVNVYTAYIDPTANDIGASVPGSFIGQDATKFYSLASAGMIAVELESTAGVALQLATGKPAAVKLLIPGSLQADAPAKIPTWSLNDRGVWIREGEATKNGTSYEFTVSHFSFWNCDIPNSSIYLCVNVKSQAGQPMANSYVVIKPTSAGLHGTCSGMTDSLGNGTAFVPANEVLSIKVSPLVVLSNSPCYIHTQSIGPYTGNAVAPIVVTVNAQQVLTVTGSAVDCSGSPVQNGTVFIQYGPYGMLYGNIVNGNYNIPVYHCNPINTVEVVVKDNTAQQQSSNVTVMVAGNIANAGSLAACGTSTLEYVNYTVDGVLTQMSPAIIGCNMSAASNLNPTMPSSYINMSYSTGGTPMVKNLFINHTGVGAGTYSLVSVMGGFITIAMVDQYNSVTPLAGATITYTTFGNIGQYVEGSFNMPFKTGNPSVNHTCSGTFRLKRYS